MVSDFRSFFDVYIQPSAGQVPERDGYEFRYIAAALMVACSRADDDEAPEEEATIRTILADAFRLSESTLEKLLAMAHKGGIEDHLDLITGFVRAHFPNEDRYSLIVGLWQVAFADGYLDDRETAFIRRVGEGLDLSTDEIERARQFPERE